MPHSRTRTREPPRWLGRAQSFDLRLGEDNVETNRHPITPRIPASLDVARSHPLRSPKRSAAHRPAGEDLQGARRVEGASPGRPRPAFDVLGRVDAEKPEHRRRDVHDVGSWRGRTHTGPVQDRCRRGRGVRRPRSNDRRVRRPPPESTARTPDVFHEEVPGKPSALAPTSSFSVVRRTTGAPDPSRTSSSSVRSRSMREVAASGSTHPSRLRPARFTTRPASRVAGIPPRTRTTGTNSARPLRGGTSAGSPPADQRSEVSEASALGGRALQSFGLLGKYPASLSHRLMKKRWDGGGPKP